ncbi:MAG: hypothetical protein H7Z72_24805 [Bacteroidetes bacterium]|nr:hypothetical protein [Fibrella sp.]
MRLNLKPVTIPFKVGDVVFVNQPYSSLADTPSATDHKPYFKAEIVRIFLEFPSAVSVVQERKDVHDLVMTLITYDLKPLDFYAGSRRVTWRVDLESSESWLFSTEAAMLAAEAIPDKPSQQ